MPLSDPSKNVLGGPGRQKEGHVTHTGYEAQPALTCSVALEECIDWLRLSVDHLQLFVSCNGS